MPVAVLAINDGGGGKVQRVDLIGLFWMRCLQCLQRVIITTAKTSMRYFSAFIHHRRASYALYCYTLYVIYLEYILFDLRCRILLLLYYDYLTMDHHHPGMDMGHGGHGDMDMGGGQCNMNVSLLLHIYS